MATDRENIQIKGNWPAWRWILTGLNLFALVMSIILSWHSVKGGSMIGCGGGSPCDLVLSSKWSKLAGILPISSLAVGIYLVMFVASFFIGSATEAPIRRLAWKVMVILAGSVAGSAIWFTILQKYAIGSFCPYCMTTHITGMLLALLIIWQAISGSQERIFRPLPALGLALVGLTLAGALAASQVILTPSTQYLEGESQNDIPAFDHDDVPMVGYKDAPYIVSLLFDYQCPHCQKLHLMLNEAIRRYDGRLAFVLCPAPLNPECNPYIPQIVDEYKNSCELAKIGLAVWLANHDAFHEFDNWMFTFESGDLWHPRSIDAARTKAVELVGQEKFDAALADPWIEEYLQTSVDLYGKASASGNGGVPKLLYGKLWVIPQPYDVNELIQIMQERLDLPKP